MWRAQLLFLMTALVVSLPARAADEANVLVGPAAFGDWTHDAPGVTRHIKADSLPPPNATESAKNGPHLVSRPPNALPKAPDGFTVSLFFDDLKEPRQLVVAPNGDIFVAESGAERIRVLRANPDGGQIEKKAVFAEGFSDRPYGLAFYPPGPEPQFLYVATQTQILRFPYHNGDLNADGMQQVIISDLPEGGHWTRDVTFSPDGAKMYVSVGSQSNDAESGIEQETRRANILEYNPDGSGEKVFASGLRNPVTILFHPQTGELWTTVNERDGLGDDLPPDYVTHVVKGGFYGWPFYYIGAHDDPENSGKRADLRDKVLVPDVLVQPHSAPLGFTVYNGTQFPKTYRGDLFVALHGSWNREKRTGYKIVRVTLDHGKPTGEYQDFLVGFVTPDGVWGRPVGVAVAKDGALLVSDDASGSLWRIAYKP